MTTRQEEMVRLKSLKGELATRYDVREIGIFGTVAWEEHTAGTDIDLLIGFGSQAIRRRNLRDEDLVSKGGLKERMRDAGDPLLPFLGYHVLVAGKKVIRLPW
jgi:hypothetical protein